MNKEEKKFAYFLNNEDALYRFKKACYCSDKSSLMNFINPCYLLKLDSRIINRGFIWSRTNEGLDFWPSIADKWYGKS